MSRQLLVAAAIAAAASWPAHAAGTVRVNYVKPETFADTGHSRGERERTLAALTGHFEQLAKRLPDGQTLKLDVKQVDLAGELKPTRTGEELRVLNGGADWPHIVLHYTLLAGANTLKTGDADLSDMNYQFGIRPAGMQREPLAYEKRMIDTWFGKTFTTTQRTTP